MTDGHRVLPLPACIWPWHRERAPHTHQFHTHTVCWPAAIFVSKGINSNTCSVYCPGALVMFLINVLLTGTAIPRVGSGGEKIDNLATSTFKLVSFDLALVYQKETKITVASAPS